MNLVKIPVPTNRMKGIKKSKENSACVACLQKSLANSKAFGVKRVRTYKFSTRSKREFIK
jgi:hypothetical protein